MLSSPFFQKYLLPGFVFQSMVIAGGYGTGRELVEFFLNFGPLGGLLAMWLISTVIWSLVCAVTFELARKTQTFEYRGFARILLGRMWVLYEVCYLVMMTIVLSVIAAAAGSIVQELASLPYFVGVALMMIGVGFLVLKGTPLVEKFLSIWSLVLYGVYIVFLIACFVTFGGDIMAGLSAGEVKPGWFRGGVEYAAYNVGTLPAVLFTIRHLERRKEALVAGLLSGPIAILPGFFFFLAMTGRYPEILPETVPSLFLLNVVGSRLLLFAYQIMLLGTLVETGTALIHAFNERVASSLEEKHRRVVPVFRPVVAIGLLLVAALVAQVGLQDLIAKGYGTVTYGFWLVFLIPVLTWGVYRVFAVR
ncbi:MAG TPA: hypothetical protein VLK65_26210 [Vicinamibacteria bacterium]|nr:hypothetical protein [Vicinamibacteria bacterium]